MATVGSNRQIVRRIVLMACGMSFLWPCLGSFATMHFRHAMAYSASAIASEWHAVVLSLLYLAAICACLSMRKAVYRELTSSGAGRTVLGLALMGLLGHLALVASPHLGDSAPLVTGIVIGGFVLSVAFIVSHILAWGLLLGTLPPACAAFAVVASNALSFAAQLAVDSLMGGTLLIYLVICPTVSGAMWYVAKRHELQESVSVEKGCTVRTREPADEALFSLPQSLRGLPWKFIVPVIALIYFEQAFTSLLFQRYMDWPRENLTVTLAMSCAIWLVVSAWLVRKAGDELSGRDGAVRHAALTEKDARRWDAALVGLFSVLLVVYMGALLTTVLFSEREGLLVERLLVAAGSALRVLLWLALMCATMARRTSPVVAYLAYVLFILAIPVSRLSSIAFARMDADTIERITSTQSIVPAAGIMLFVVAAGFVLGNTFATRRAITGADETGGGTSTAGAIATSGDGCGAPNARAGMTESEAAEPAHLCLARTYGLSARETEVLELIGRGYSAKRIGEKLFISESTVVSHTTHIYRKTGVSSKQELIDLLDK